MTAPTRPNTNPGSTGTPANPTRPGSVPAQGRASPMDAADLALLRHFLEEQALQDTEKTLGLTQPTAYRRLQGLVEIGAVRHNGSLFSTSALGRRLLSGDVALLAAERILKARVPALGLMPTRLHRAALELMVFAFIARRDALVSETHPSFILLGATQRLKSWLVKILCYSIGVDPEKARLSMAQVRRRGLLARLGANGELTYENEVLEQFVIWGEELSLAEADVRRDVETLVEGRDAIKIENQTLPVRGVIVFELNPRKADGTLEERVGLRAQRLRRCAVADFTSLRLSPKTRARSAEILEELKAQGPLKLPPAPRGRVEPDTSELVVTALDLCTLPGHEDYVDAARVLALVAGAKALLDERPAAERVLFSYLTLAESCGHARPSWRADLAELLYPAVSAPLVTAPTPPAPAKDSAPENTEETMPAIPPSAYLLHEKLMALKAFVDAHSLRVPEDLADLGTALAIQRYASNAGSALAQYWVEHTPCGGRLTAVLIPTRTTDVKRLERVAWLCDRLADLGVSLEQLEDELIRKIQGSGTP